MSIVNFQQKTLKEIKPLQKNKHISQSNKFLHHKFPSPPKKTAVKVHQPFLPFPTKNEVGTKFFNLNQTPEALSHRNKILPNILDYLGGVTTVLGLCFLLQVLPMVP